MKSGNLNFLEPSGPLQACNGAAIPLPLFSDNLRPHETHMDWTELGVKTSLRTEKPASFAFQKYILDLDSFKSKLFLVLINTSLSMRDFRFPLLNTRELRPSGLLRS
jgi:hypothetical protein